MPEVVQVLGEELDAPELEILPENPHGAPREAWLFVVIGIR